ncbi:hypothetical protein GGF31_002523 [Allomyces arbusculus]|nr:hypothetical protein GGF31_002523 [Allomyces arbusculus]
MTSAGTLTVRVERARELRNVEMAFGKMDPFVKVTLHQTVLTTEVAKDGHKNPKWENAKPFEFTVPSEHGAPNARALWIEIYDKNYMSDDKLIGTGILNLPELIEHASTDAEPAFYDWVEVRTPSDQRAGEVLLKVWFKPASQSSPQQQQLPLPVAHPVGRPVAYRPGQLPGRPGSHFSSGNPSGQPSYPAAPTPAAHTRPATAHTHAAVTPAPRPPPRPVAHPAPARPAPVPVSAPAPAPVPVYLPGYSAAQAQAPVPVPTPVSAPITMIPTYAGSSLATSANAGLSPPSNIPKRVASRIHHGPRPEPPPSKLPRPPSSRPSPSSSPSPKPAAVTNLASRPSMSVNGRPGSPSGRPSSPSRPNVAGGPSRLSHRPTISGAARPLPERPSSSKNPSPHTSMSPLAQPPASMAPPASIAAPAEPMAGAFQDDPTGPLANRMSYLGLGAPAVGGLASPTSPMAPPPMGYASPMATGAAAPGTGYPSPMMPFGASNAGPFMMPTPTPLQSPLQMPMPTPGAGSGSNGQQALPPAGPFALSMPMPQAPPVLAQHSGGSATSAGGSPRPGPNALPDLPPMVPLVPAGSTPNGSVSSTATGGNGGMPADLPPTVPMMYTGGAMAGGPMQATSPAQTGAAPGPWALPQSGAPTPVQAPYRYSMYAQPSMYETPYMGAVQPGAFQQQAVSGYQQAVGGYPMAGGYQQVGQQLSGYQQPGQPMAAYQPFGGVQPQMGGAAGPAAYPAYRGYGY